MKRIFVLVFLLALAAGPSHAAENAPADTPLQEFQLLSLEKAKLAEKLREVIAFERFYAGKKAKLQPESQRLEKEQEYILEQKPKVNAQCPNTDKMNKRTAAVANAKCDKYRPPFEARMAKYAASYKQLKEEIDALDEQESTRKALQETTTQRLAEATALLAKLEKLVPASKEKECILACNAQGAEAVVGAQQCVQACIPAESKVPE